MSKSSGAMWGRAAARGVLLALHTALLLAPLPALHAAEANAKRPNILWLAGENIKLDLGCYGAELVRTPNLDRLAAEGVRYTRVFTTNPACAPSRSAFFTGMYQTTTDTHHMRSHRDDDFRLPPGVRPITHLLRDAGYFTANIKTIGGRNVGTGKLDLNFVNEGPIYESADWSALKARQPFFAVVNSHEVEYDIYDRQSAKKPRVEWVGEREHEQIATPENVTPPPYYPDHPVVRQEWARYLNSVSGMDRRIGWVLDQLRKDGLEEDTVIFFFADNGRLEARGIHWCYDSGLHVPLIIRWPKHFPAPPQVKPGTVNGQVISLLDLTATTLAVAGVPRPLLMQSRNFLGAQADPPRRYAFSARDRIDETVHRIRSVRDARWRYIRNYTPGPTFASLNRYKEKCFLVMGVMRELQAQEKLTGAPADLMARRGPSEELYDIDADPYEIHNLADSDKPEHRETLLRLQTALEVWMVETGDRGAIPERPNVSAAFAKEMEEWFGTPTWAKQQGGEAPEPKVTPVPDEIIKKFKLDTSFYKKHLDYKGFSILSSAEVSDAALLEARYLIERLLGKREDILKAMIQSGCRFMVMAPKEMTTDVPEQRHMKNDPKVNWDQRARGLGGKLSSCGEENLLNLRGDRYKQENILIHEFNHAIHQQGLRLVDPTFDRRLRKVYKNAMAKGRWKDTYVATNPAEYWAEAAQAYFDCMRPQFGANTREKLEKYDPDLFKLVDEVYRQSPFRYVRYDQRKAPLKQEPPARPKKR